MDGGSSSIGGYFTNMLDPSMTWNDVERMVAEWGGKFCLKGVMTAEDARHAADIGCAGIVLSNHGGRQLAYAPSPLEILPQVADRVGHRLAVLVDGGVRRGSDIAKARALGAQAVLLGRAPLYGLAARGRHGVDEVLAILRRELEITLRLLGRCHAAGLDASALDERHRQQLSRWESP
jgi:isopentenyl diphosphate isomerase/L-lactate dehydrogenase-like FMN-dependent dehydrogenase